MCAAIKACGVGKWTVSAGTETIEAMCQTCSNGRFRSAAPTSGKVEIETEVCQVHKTCAAGEWTEAKGTDKTDTQCKSCSSGRYRDSAPEGKSKEIESEVCQIHKTCAEDQWIAAKGTDKTNTQCKTCSAGRYRDRAPKTKSKETEAGVCQIHKTCAAGEWTSVEGTSKTNTQCKPCSLGRYRGSVPKDKFMEIELEVCNECVGKDLYSDQPGLSVCKTCRPGESGLTEKRTVAGAHVLCADITPPVITLNGDEVITVGQGQAYKDPHAVSDGNEGVKSTVCNALREAILFALVILISCVLAG